MERPINHEREAPPTVAIIGGEGAMGALTAHLFEKMGTSVVLCDIRNSNLPSAREAVQMSQIIFFSTPAQEIPKILAQIDDLITQDHVIIDNASIKEPFARKFLELAQRGVSICSTHPMTSPQTLNGEKVLIMQVGQNSKKAREVARTLFLTAGMLPVEIPFLEHDKTLAIAQGWAHICSWAEAIAMDQMGISIDELLKLATPNSKLKLASTARTLIQSPDLSLTIVARAVQTQEGRQFLESFIRTLQMLMDQTNSQNLALTFSETKEHLDKNGAITKIGQMTPPLIDILKDLV